MDPAPPLLLQSGEIEAQGPSAYWWGQRVCGGPLRLPRTPANSSKAYVQMGSSGNDTVVSQPFHRGLSPRATRVDVTVEQ